MSDNTVASTEEDENLEISRVIPFNNTTPSSIAVDPLRNLVYVSVNPGYPYNYTLSLCAEENAASSFVIPTSISACSAIYVLDGNSSLVYDIIRLLIVACGYDFPQILECHR
jgi:DNA-binding beta-propeller fold protein YncE